MKMTLLDMTQNILNAMDSDTVNSIEDTVESLQVAEFVREAFFELTSQRDWPFLRTKDSLVGLSDLTNPTKMQMPDNINKMLWVKYNKKEVNYLPPEDFQNLLDNRIEQTGVTDANGYALNRDPLYWTTFDDKYIYFDGYNVSEDSTLQQSKSVIYAVKEAAWTHADSFIPDLPEKFFSTLLAEAKATCFINLKQTQNPREERKSQRGRVRLQNESWRNEVGEIKSNTLINYGRR